MDCDTFMIQDDPHAKNEVSKSRTNLEKKHRCNFDGCNAVFLKPANLQYHMNVHLNLRPFKCNFAECTKSYSSPSHLNRHVQQNHSKKNMTHKFKCKQCNNYFSNLSNLKRHIKTFHSETSMYCKECNLRFKSEKLYLEHVQRHSTQSIESQAFECELCGQKLSSARAFKRHKYRHTKTLYPCPHENCSAEFYTVSLLSEHKKSCHFTVYECADCAKRFSLKKNLKLHVLIHLEERAIFPCLYKKCNRVYYFKKNLKQHIQIQHLGKKFKCLTCGLQLSSKQKLNHHMTRIHIERGKQQKHNNVKKKAAVRASVDKVVNQ